MGEVKEHDSVKDNKEGESTSEAYASQLDSAADGDEAESREPRDADSDVTEGHAPAEAEPDDLETQHRDLSDRHLRLAADFDNYRKRTAREWAQRVEGATADLLLDLLEIADNFDRALRVEHVEGAYAEGVRMIFQQLQGLLRRRGVEVIEALGQPFDPTRHEALLHVASDDYAEGEVCQEIRRGYTLHEKILRPAQVAVSRGTQTPEQLDVNEAH